MDKLNHYRTLIKKLLAQYAAVPNRLRPPEVETFCVFDETHDHYIWMSNGWTTEKRIRNTHAHLRLHNEKIWIEEDWTEWGIATDLLEAGVPKEDIVLAFHPPEMRQYTEFAAA